MGPDDIKADLKQIAKDHNLDLATVVNVIDNVALQRRFKPKYKGKKIITYQFSAPLFPSI